ncbi:hypothetical protein ACLB2K_045528 [Fragaria x ananassa]
MLGSLSQYDVFMKVSRISVCYLVLKFDDDPTVRLSSIEFSFSMSWVIIRVAFLESSSTYEPTIRRVTIGIWISVMGCYQWRTRLLSMMKD